MTLPKTAIHTDLAPLTHGGARKGAGRKPKLVYAVTLGADVATAIVASCAGESSVTLEALSGGQIKPKVTVVHRDPLVASTQCQAIFDELAVKYWKTAEKPA